MKKIFLDGKEVHTLVPESLPMLIHGAQGSGSSLYTICLAALWLSLGYKILFLCGFPMAEEEFAKQVDGDYPNAIFYTQEKVAGFLHAIKQESFTNTIVIVKNIELFGDDVLDAVRGMNNLIISGDISLSPLKKELLEIQFTTEVYFSALEGKQLPEIEKFQGYVLSGDYKGITHLQ